MSTDIETIKQRLDLVEFIQEYFPLKRAGANYKAVCPFHQEKTPSLMVSPSKQIWHCFGCQEGGDIFTFLQKMEGIEFSEALLILADRAGVKLENKKTVNKEKKEKLLEILSLSERFYQTILKDHSSTATAREYLQTRKINTDTIDLFKLGYAPQSWDLLARFLTQKGFSFSEMQESGLVIYNPEKKTYYDRFRHRIMIPLKDVYGRTVGFTGRTLDKDFVGGKYVNTPQTVLYDKSRLVFAMDLAKQEIKNKGYAVIVEGNMDAISSHQAGVREVVAISGTALTREQLLLLKRFTSRLVFAYDADSAGQQASERGVPLALSEGMDVKILTIPTGKDPDDCIKSSVDLWKNAINTASPVLDHVLARELTKNDVKTSAGKKVVADKYLSILKFFINSVERDHYLRKLTDELGVSRRSIDEMFQVITQTKAKSSSKNKPDKVHSKTDTAFVDDDLLKEILALNIVGGNFLASVDLPEDLLVDKLLFDLYKKLKFYYSLKQVKDSSVLDLDRFYQELSDPESKQLFAQIQLYGEQEFGKTSLPELKQAFSAKILLLQRRFLQKKLNQIRDLLKDAELNKDTPLIERYTQEINQIFRQLAD